MVDSAHGVSIPNGTLETNWLGVVVEDNAIFNNGQGIFVREAMSGGNRLSNNTVLMMQ